MSVEIREDIIEPRTLGEFRDRTKYISDDCPIVGSIRFVLDARTGSVLYLEGEVQE